MPGWHEATKTLQDEGVIQMVGIIQEQHPDRARLFMQWKEMGWPLLVDSYNLLEVPYVPITLALDESGVIQRLLPRLEDEGQLGQDFVEEAFGVSAHGAAPQAAAPDLDALARSAHARGGARAWRDYADALAVWGGDDQIDTAIDAYETAARIEPGDGTTHFRLGVAHRMRYDSEAAEPGDFQKAVERWGTALDIDPNQYIWRRRIQQYGPRLDKPYPFYDWIHAARDEIRARGEDPAPLTVEPRGSEFATPAESFEAGSEEEAEPDPLGRVLQDEGHFIEVETVSVPASVAPGEVARLHAIFRPIAAREAHWNNEADDMVLWIDPPQGWAVETRMLRHPVPPAAVSDEVRTLEIEVRAPENARGGAPAVIPAYALYYVCEDVDGICMYRRQDVELEVAIRR